MAPATAEAPEPETEGAVRVATVWNLDKKKQPTSKKYDHVLGLPGGAPGAAGLIILMPVPGVEEREIFTEVVGGQTFFRSWRKERHFKESPRFPEGLEIGVIAYHVDTGTGVPFEENAFPQCGQDGYDRLRAYAYEQPYLAMHERRKIAEDTDQWRAESQSTGGRTREGTKSPTDVLQEVADDRLAQTIAALVEKGVNEALAKRDAADKAKVAKGAGS